MNVAHCIINFYWHGQLSPDFNFGLYDLDWDVFSTHIEAAVHRVPHLEKIGIKSTVSGPGKSITSSTTHPMCVCVVRMKY